MPSISGSFEASPISEKSPVHSENPIILHNNLLADLSNPGSINRTELESVPSAPNSIKDLVPIVSTDNTEPATSVPFISAESSSRLNITIELPNNAPDSLVNTIQPSHVATKEASLLTSNSWADLAEEENNNSKTTKKNGKKVPKITPTARTRTGQTSNNSLRNSSIGISEGLLINPPEILSSASLNRYLRM